MDLEFMILDTFDTLRPSGLIRFQSLEEADEVCKKIEDRELQGQDIVDILARYHKDGGGYLEGSNAQQDYWEEEYYEE